MRWRWLAPGALAGFVGCFLPSYSLDPPGASSQAGSSTGAAGAFAGVGSSGSSGDGGADMGGSMQVRAGSSGFGGDSGGGAPQMSGCAAGKKDCAGACVDIDDVKYGCTATSCNQSACPTGAEGFACEDGACVIGTCPFDQKKCGDRCVSVKDPTYGCSTDGCDASACPKPGDGTLVCSGSSCVLGTCDAKSKKCGSNCVPLDAANGCAETGRCTACDASEICDGAPSVCTCVSDNVEACKGRACGPSLNNCGDVVDCNDTCTLPDTCGGGTADKNHCGCTAVDACVGVACGVATNNCGETKDCGSSCSAPTPECANNKCVECNAPGDCPTAQCAKAACTSHKCTYTPLAASTSCTGGGTCSPTDAGVCVRKQVTVDTYKVDATEVTRGQYKLFLAAKNGNVSGQRAECTANASYVPSSLWPPTITNYDLPVTYVDWCDAAAYCTWAGGRICGKIGGGAATGYWADPATRQLLHACEGPSATAYPYGNSFVSNRCNAGAPAAVASFPQCTGGYAGLYDLSGNVAEWEDQCDEFDDCYTRGATADSTPMADLRCDKLHSYFRTGGNEWLGFRCCSSP